MSLLPHKSTKDDKVSFLQLNFQNRSQVISDDLAVPEDSTREEH